MCCVEKETCVYVWVSGRAVLSGGNEGQPCLLRPCVIRVAVAGHGRCAVGLFLEDTERYILRAPLVFLVGCVVVVIPLRGASSLSSSMSIVSISIGSMTPL